VQARYAVWLPLIAAAAVHGRSLSHDFVYDDYLLIVDAPRPESARDFARVFAEPHWPGLPYYRPVSRLTMRVQKALHDNDPAPYHAFNFLVAGALGALLYLVLRRPAIGAAPAAASCAAIAFVVHPIASSCVYPIASGRETLLPTLFSLAAIAAYLTPGRAGYLGALAAFALSLLSKEQAVVVPGILALADLTLFRRPFLQVALRMVPFALVLAAHLALRASVIVPGQHTLALVEHPEGPLLSLVFFAQTALVPFVELLYEPRLEIWVDPARLVATAAIVLWVAARARRTDLPALFALGWIALGLLPTANILHQDAGFDERYGYLSLAGLMLILAKVVPPKVWAAPLILLGAISFYRGEVFRDPLGFLHHWAKTDPESAQPPASLGEFHARLGETDKAIAYYQEALRLRPRYFQVHANLGILLQDAGRKEEAAEHYREALKIRPRAKEARSNLSEIMFGLRRFDDPSPFSAALELDPAYPPALAGLAEHHLARGEYEEARRLFESAIAAAPGWRPARLGLARTSSAAAAAGQP
jgi:tetratricopeptide (TPR) repeat protein